MNNSVNDTTANETAIKGKLISKLTREQFEESASDADAWEIVSHEATCDFTMESGVTYCEMSIRNNSLGIFVSGIQFGSDEDGDVDDGFTSEHKFDDVKVFDDETNKSIVFPVNFGSEDNDCDKGWFLDLIDDVVNDKINEVADEYSVSEQCGDDDFDFDDMDSYGFGEPGHWSITTWTLERSDEDEDDDEDDDEGDAVTVTGEFYLSDFTNSNIDLDFKGCFDFSVTIKAEFSKSDVRWIVEEITCETDDSNHYGSILDKLRSKFADWIDSSEELDDLCAYIVKNEMKLD